MSLEHFVVRHSKFDLKSEDLTEELLTSLKGMPVTSIAPNHWPTEGTDEIYGCVRRVCKGYVAQASLSEGITIRGQGYFTLDEEDVDIVCINLKYHSLEDLCRVVNMVLAGGINDRSRRPKPESGSGKLLCAFS